MRVYIDEMQNSCGYCLFQDQETNTCCIDNGINCPWQTHKKAKGCPLHSLPDHDQQVRADERKKVVGEIRPQLYKHFNVNSLEEYEKLPLLNSLFTLDVVTEILDQVEKGESNEN